MRIRKYLPLLRALVSIATLALLLSIYDFRHAFHLVMAMSGMAFAGAVLAFVVTTLLFVARWNLTLPRSVGLLRTARGYVASYFYSLLPTGQAGAELGKVMTLANHADLRLLAASVIFDKLAGLLALCLLGGLAWFFAASATLWMVLLVLGMAAVCIAALACAPFASSLLALLQRRTLNKRPGFFMKAASLSQPITNWVMNPILLVKVLGLGLAGQACMVLVYVLIAGALGIHLPLSNLVLLVVIANLATLVPVSLGGVGVREASLVGLLTEQHVRGELAIALSLTVFAIFLLGAGAGAIVELHNLSNVWKRLSWQRKARGASGSVRNDDP